MTNPTKLSPRYNASNQGFTLVELLVVMAIVAIIASITTATLSTLSKRGATMEEMAAGRNLIGAYLAYATENDGNFMPATNGMPGVTIETPEGKTHGTPIAPRYTYRLAPYLNNQLEGTFITKANRASVNAAKTQIDKDYLISVQPAFGINAIFVGGQLTKVKNDAVVTFGDDVATRQNQLNRPIVAFVTASGSNGSPGTYGFHRVDPPRSYVPLWTSAKWTPQANPSQYGMVHARHDDKALCAMTDGSVQAYSVEELRDIRLWSKNAANNDDIDYQVPSPF